MSEISGSGPLKKVVHNEGETAPADEAPRGPVDGFGGGPNRANEVEHVLSGEDGGTSADLVPPQDKGRVTDGEGREVSVRSGRVWARQEELFVDVLGRPRSRTVISSDPDLRSDRHEP